MRIIEGRRCKHVVYVLFGLFLAMANQLAFSQEVKYQENEESAIIKVFGSDQVQKDLNDSKDLCSILFTQKSPSDEDVFIDIIYSNSLTSKYYHFPLSLAMLKSAAKGLSLKSKGLSADQRAILLIRQVVKTMQIEILPLENESTGIPMGVQND